ncbi:MAG TPA: amidase family protein [Burkholderiales bacterium]|nr:amidase family protein [Burkholderiales bacterium]
MPVDPAVSAFSSATELAAAMRARRTTAAELVELHLSRIERHNPSLNAICTLDAPGARRRAREADAALARGELWGALHGVPMTIKDALETAGLRTTGGHPPLKDHVPTKDAPAVARLRAAGAILLGKTNVPPLSADYRADNPIFGRTNNPWNLERTPGGSTGGGAAAVAAGLSAFDVGSDLAGSVRTPAHYCGLFGLKATERRIPNTGHIPEPPGEPRAVRHMNVLGPLARSVDDLALITKTISGPDEAEWDLAPAPWIEPPERALGSYRFAWSTAFGGVPVTAETRQAIQKLAADLVRAGCKVAERNPEGFSFDEAWETWGEIAITERAATGGERSRERVAALNATLGERWAVARGSAKGMRATVADYMLALTRRDQLITTLERFFASWDAFICPVTVCPAIPHVPFGTPIDVDGEKVPYFIAGTAYTSPFNLTGHPSVVLPVTRAGDGMPIGAQLVGRRWSEPALLALARKVGLITGPFTPPPGYQQ